MGGTTTLPALDNISCYPQPQQTQQPCPCCGRCPVCGRGGYNTQPWPYPTPTWGYPITNGIGQTSVPNGYWS